MSRPRALTERAVETCVRLHGAGWSCREIGRRLGVSHGTVWNALRGRVVARGPHRQQGKPGPGAKQGRASYEAWLRGHDPTVSVRGLSRIRTRRSGPWWSKFRVV